jgi:crossover junction endodeoxyribonuclease RusA
MPTAAPDLTFEVLGQPKPQGSHRAIQPKHGGPPIVIDSAGAPLKDWRRAITDAAREARDGADTFDEPVAVSLAFRMKRPQHPTWAYPATTPDVDKLARACLDALTAARVIRDDARVIQLHVTKTYESASSPPGLVCKVWRIAPPSPW